jgi:hypothetical protein
MPIVIRIDTTSKVVQPSDFGSEKDLEDLLASRPELLGEDGEEPIAFVSRQVNLPDAGRLDLLFVTSEGLPVAVEVKLARNGESRRDVVAQAIDYLSSLTALTVDELDNLVDNNLDIALHGLAGGDDSEFERTWAAVARNLRDGRARLIVALDEAPLSLERIFRFLARKSLLDVRLLTVQRHADPDGSEIFVPRLLVNPDSEGNRGPVAPGQKTMEERLALCNNKVAIEFFRQRFPGMETNSHKNALAFRRAGGKIHFYVEPSPIGAAVTQIDRFEDDEAIWNQGLSNPNIKPQTYVGKANLRFDLTSSSDFEFFAQTVEKGPPLPWAGKK